MGKRLGKINGPAVALVAAAVIITAVYLVYCELTHIRLAEERKVLVVDCIVNTCVEQGVPPALAVAMFTQESSLRGSFKTWEPKLKRYVYSTAQISYLTAHAEGFNGEEDELFDYPCSIWWGVKHIKTLLYVYDGDICKVIMAYNAGDAVSGNYTHLERVLKYYRVYYPEFECEVK